ncbi:acyl-CoA oxidase [Lujinxingia vulgaris]|uniref:acyl-CoA oxidase n=1 Tax=Lujinxingia vulgaris TaxID=2600176 RepID=A0A5C6XJ70_9DELT|nr:acyl-CoA dehydrogenase [Lujinxingia vulgaris]TXD38240.1 acyl-CoA oxidase [Lujinxingia vulgaris]
MSASTPGTSHPDLEALQALLDARQLLPLLPMIYVAWADGELHERELLELRERMTKMLGLSSEDQEVLASWLDPENPPGPVALRYLLRALHRDGGALATDERLSLAELGMRMALAAPPAEGSPANEELRTSLREIEKALGVVGTEATEQLRPEARDTSATLPARNLDFDPKKLGELLDAPHRATREMVRELLAGDQFEYTDGLPLKDYRELVVTWLKALADSGIGDRCVPDKRADGTRDMSEFLAIFETLGHFDLSLLVKFGVQFGLFGGSIMFMGTEHHHRTYLPRLASLELQGCYAMTEMGRGSNVRDLETTATYDPDSKSFIIHTPTETARKEWIGGAGTYATLATVYAQLIVEGVNHGVHALLVPIRDAKGQPMPGVRIEDQGLKMGLNGVDNGRIWFDQVRVPRENLLNRYGNVSEEGHYESPIPSPNKRFFTMLGTLVAGRLGVSAGGLSAAKSALTIATRYSDQRRQFGPAGAPEIPVLDYRMQQRALLPRIATAYALTFALRELTRRYNSVDPDRRQTEALAAGLKAYASNFALGATQAAREACGGQGYLWLNRIAAIRTDVDVFATFEGANVVMLQQVAKARIGEYAHELNDGNFFTMARVLTRQATRTLSETNPVVTRNTDTEHLDDADFQLDALSYRESDLVSGVARRIKSRIDKGMDSFEAFNDCQDHVIAVANANVERFVLECFIEAEKNTTDAALRRALSQLRKLFALSIIEKDMAWFLENGYVQGNKAAAIRDRVNTLCAELRPDAVAFVDAFQIPDTLLSAPIAFSEGKAPADAQVEHARGIARD